MSNVIEFKRKHNWRTHYQSLDKIELIDIIASDGVSSMTKEQKIAFFTVCKESAETEEFYTMTSAYLKQLIDERV